MLLCEALRRTPSVFYSVPRTLSGSQEMGSLSSRLLNNIQVRAASSTPPRAKKFEDKRDVSGYVSMMCASVTIFMFGYELYQCHELNRKVDAMSSKLANRSRT